MIAAFTSSAAVLSADRRTRRRLGRAGSGRPGRRGTEGRDGGQAIGVGASGRGRGSPLALGARPRRQRDRARGGSCASSAGKALASRDVNTSSAAADAFLRVGIGEGQRAERRGDPMRSPLLTRTVLKESTLTPSSFSPVLALIRRRRCLVDEDMRRWIEQQPVVAERVKDRRRVAAPVAASSPTACSVLANLLSKNFANASSSGSARAEARAAQEEEDGDEARERHGDSRGGRSGRAATPGAVEDTRIRAPLEGGFERRGCNRVSSDRAAQPPHLPVLTLKLPQDSGLRQSEIRSREPSR